jgi:hypothetical protein
MSFHKTNKIKSVLLALQAGEVKEEINLSDIPEKKVEEANERPLKTKRSRSRNYPCCTKQ